MNPVTSVPDYETYARPYNRLGARLGEHWSIVGATGSGKTRFSVALLEYYRRQFPHAKRYVLDSSGDGMPEVHAPAVVEGDRVPDLLTRSVYTQVWQPETDILDNYNEWLLRILRARQPAIVLIDELASLTSYDTASNILEGHFKLLKQGRKHGITVINETQEIARVSLTIFRQMSWFVQFRLNRDPWEWSRARNYLNILKEEQNAPSAPYGFFMRRVTGNFPAREFRSYQELFANTVRTA